MDEGPILVRPVEDWPASRPEVLSPVEEREGVRDEEVPRSFLAMMVEPVWVLVCLMVAGAVLHAQGTLTYERVLMGLGIVLASIVLRTVVALMRLRAQRTQDRR